jgi:hypothetical protein
MDPWIHNGSLYLPETSFWGADTVWRANFAGLPLSTTSNATELTNALAALGLTFTRASSATVQTSIDSLVASGIGTDVPRIGDAGYGRGLLMEEARTNEASRCSELDNATWAKFATTVTADTSVAPDGATTADTIAETATTNVHLIQQSTLSVNGTDGWVISAWARQGTRRYAVLRFGTSAGYEITMDLQTGTVANSSAVSSASVRGSATGWLRGSFVCVPASGVSAFQFAMSDTGGAYHSYAGSTSNNLLAWGFQLEKGKYPTELIPTTSTTVTRAADRLAHSTPSRLVNAGRLGLELRFIPRATLANYDATNGFYLWTNGPAGGNSYAWLNPGDSRLYVRVNGTDWTPTTTISWAVGDVVDFWVEAGGGSLASVAKYRVNGGAAVSIGSTSAQGSISTSAVIDFFGAAAVGVSSAWVQHIRAYRAGRRPTWAA